MASSLEEWGATMRLARRAALLATEEMRSKGVISDPLDSSILLYTDDLVAYGWFKTEPTMANICKCSAIEGVEYMREFPPDAHEAKANDELPRVAAMWFPAPGAKCPRCRNFTKLSADVCPKCVEQIARLNPAAGLSTLEEFE